MLTTLENSSISKVLNKKFNWWKLNYPIELNINGEIIHIPAGYESDLITVPRFLYWLIPPHGLGAIPAIKHDFLCEYKVVPRYIADKEFKIDLKKFNLPFWEIFLMFYYVRLLGWVTYGKVNPKSTPIETLYELEVNKDIKRL